MVGVHIPHLPLKGTKGIRTLRYISTGCVKVCGCFVTRDMLRTLKQQQLKKSVIKLWLKIKKKEKKRSNGCKLSHERGIVD